MINIKLEADYIQLKKLVINVHSEMNIYLPLQNANDVPADPITDVEGDGSLWYEVFDDPDDTEFVNEKVIVNIKNEICSFNYFQNLQS